MFSIGLFKTRNSERVKSHASQIKCFATHTNQNRLSAAAAGRQWGPYKAKQADELSHVVDCNMSETLL